jgi:sucrose phosphorylase
VEPDVWELLEEYAKDAGERGAEILPEIHEHYSLQLKLAERGYWVYDFALPMLVLHALYSGESGPLVHWFSICPRKQFTTLDTHDGIGAVDVKGLLSDAEIQFTQNMLYQRGANVKPKYSGAEYNNLDVYQINCTYYSALGNDDDAYLFARAIQFFAPGIPQVYYVGLLAGKNDIELLEKTKEGRNINRHNYTTEEIAAALKRPVVAALFRLCRFRNYHPAFGGIPEMPVSRRAGTLTLCWTHGAEKAIFKGNLRERQFRIEYTQSGTTAVMTSESLLEDRYPIGYH